MRARGYALLCFFVGGIYLVWVVLNLNPAEFWMSLAFLCAELACFGLFCMACLSVWQLRFKPPGGHPAPEVMHYAVDVFIPCCGEPQQVIRTTVRAASQIRWSGPLVLYVLDDKNLPEVRQIAEMFGAVYLSRPSAFPQKQLCIESSTGTLALSNSEMWPSGLDAKLPCRHRRIRLGYETGSLCPHLDQ